MAKKSVKKNYLYNLVYQVFALIIPFITTPYVSRVLTTSGIGQYSFTFSIASYFTLFAALGFVIYAQREIARNQGNRHEQSIIFWEVIIARLLSVGISVCLYFVLFFSGVYGDTYTTLMLILSINVIGTALDVTFIFQGNEEFGIIALRNIIVKIVGVALIFVFVKNESHVWVYTLCQSAVLLISNLSLWTRLSRVLEKVELKELHIKRHFIPTLRLFIPTIAISVYTMLDKTLIGLLIPGTMENVNGEIVNISDIENGHYEQAEKIVKITLTVITSLGTVMIPRNSQAISSGNEQEFKKNINGALQFVMFIGIPLMFGIASVAQNFSPWFFGPGYEKVPYLMMVFSPIILIIGLSNVLGIQYLLPLKKDRKYTIAITLGAVANLFLNLVLIPFFWSYGASVATVVAELIVTTIMLFFARKDISLCSLIKKTWKYVVSGILMFVAVFFTQYIIGPSIIHTILLVLEGITIYFGLLLLMRDDFLLGIIRKVTNRLFKRV